MPAVMQIDGLVTGRKTTVDGQYVVEYDASRPSDNTNDGLTCHLVTTSALDEAMRFPSKSEAFELWRSVDERAPTRPDGKPNRPLTAFTVSITDVDA